MATPSKIPITILTGFTGSGKTTLILNLVPQLRRSTPDYKLAMIKNEIGDLAIDTQLASFAELTATQELLGDCICCTNVGQIEDALHTLDTQSHPDRIIIETSGSAEPLKLVLEINRLAALTSRYVLDGIISVIDAENWTGYASTSFTAKLQAQQTDLIVINKWEGLAEQAFDVFLDRLGDLDVDTPQVKSDKGWVSKDLLFGFDDKAARAWLDADSHHHHHDHDHDASGEHQHTSEVECLSVTLSPSPPSSEASVDRKKLESLLRSAPKDEVYRIKGIIWSSETPKNSDGQAVEPSMSESRNRYILNWSFGRWTWSVAPVESAAKEEPIARIVIFTAPYESNKWTKKIESGQFIALDSGESKLEVKRVQ